MKKTRDFSPRMNLLQFRVLFRRYMKQILTNPWVIVPLVLEAPLMLVITSFVYEDGTFVEPWRHVTSAHSVPFLLVLSSALMGLLNSYREICKERDVLGREVFGGLDVSSYLGSKVVALALIGFVQTLILTLGSLVFIDFNMARPAYSMFFYISAVFLTNYSVTALGLLVSALLRKSESAILPVLVIIIMQVVFAGALIEFEYPVQLLYFFTPTMYGTSAVGNVMGLNAVYPMREIYDYNVFFTLAMLIVFAAVCHALTIVKLKRDYRTKD